MVMIGALQSLYSSKSVSIKSALASACRDEISTPAMEPAARSPVIRRHWKNRGNNCL